MTSLSPVFETSALPVGRTLRRSQTSCNLLLIRFTLLASLTAAGWIRTSTCAVLETAASAVGLLRQSMARLASEAAKMFSALSRTRTCNNADLGRAPLPLGYQSIPLSLMDAGGTRTLIPRVQTGRLAS